MKVILCLIILILISGCNPLSAKDTFEYNMYNCNFLKTEDEVKNCKDNIIIQRAMDKDDVEYCDVSSSMSSRDLCASLFYLSKARTTQKVSYCGMIEMDDIKIICLEQV